jgi:poly(3-hydroxybutyrate) depolymerase
VRRALCLLALLAAAAAALTPEPASADGRPVALGRLPVVPTRVKTITIRHRSHTGKIRNAYLLLPRWYGPRRHPALPLVISPHGRGVPARSNVRFWGNLPALGRFAVINPEGEGNHTDNFSWGAPGQIRDLARMPEIAAHARPWIRVDRRKIYAVGGSMGARSRRSWSRRRRTCSPARSPSTLPPTWPHATAPFL